MARDTKTKRYAENINATLQKVASAYYPEPSATDHGASGSGSSLTIYDIITGAGVSKYVHIVLRHDGNSNTTEYTLDTSIDLTLYPLVFIEFEPGAVLARTTGDEVLTLYSPKNIIASIQEITASDMLAFVKAGTVYPEWWGENTTPGTTDMTDAIQNAVSALSSVGAGEVKLSGETYFIDDTITIVDGVYVRGMGSGATEVLFDYTVTGKPIFEVSGVLHGGIEGIEIAFDELPPNTDTEANCIAATGASSSGWMVFRDLLLNTCYAGIYADNQPLFNCLFDNIIIRNWTGWGLYHDLASGGTSGNVFNSLYLNNNWGGETDKAAIGFIWYREAEAVFNQINCEHASISGQQAINFGSDNRAIIINGFHIEEVTYGYTGITSIIYAGGARSFVQINGITLSGVTAGATVTDFNLTHVYGAGTRLDVNGLTVKTDCTFSNSGDISGVYIDTTCEVGKAAVTIKNLYNENATALDNDADYGSVANRAVLQQFNDPQYPRGDIHEVLEDGSAQTILTWGVTRLDSSGGSGSGTLADGTRTGQRKRIVMSASGNNWDVTITHHATSDPEVVRFDAVGEYILLEWTGWTWVTINSEGCTFP
jgi:hypothetical protein